MFFGNIDKILLGKFVQPEFIGYYSVSFGVIGSVSSLVGFSSIALLPIFSKLRNKRLEEGFKKSLGVTFLLAVGAFIATLIFSYFAILILYGKEYIPATNILRISSILLFVLPMTSIYQSYYLSRKEPKILARFLLASAAFNIILTYLFIVILLPYGNLAAVYGASIATIISETFYLLTLVFGRGSVRKASFEAGKKSPIK